MALKTGLYPVEGKLILTPTGYLTGGTDLGDLSSTVVAGMDFDAQVLTKHETGGIPVDVRYTGINLILTFSLLHASPSLIDMMFRNTADGDAFYALQNYKLGAVASSSQLFKLLVRPIDDTGSVDSTKSFLYIPRAAIIQITPQIWSRQLAQAASTTLTVLALYDTTLSGPFAYGNYTEFPAIPSES